MLDNETKLMRRILAIDEHGALAALELPVRELTEIAKLRVDRDRIQRMLDTSPLKYAVEQFAGSADGVEQALFVCSRLAARDQNNCNAAVLASQIVFASRRTRICSSEIPHKPGRQGRLVSTTTKLKC